MNLTRRGARLLACLPALAVTSSCNSYLFEQKCPEQIKEQSIVTAAAKPTPADILFVVDNSGSMADEQENLATNFQAFIEEIAGAGDYQIMVVSTDVDSSNGERTGLQISTFAPASPNNLIDLSGAGCTDLPIAHGCARGPDAARRIISSATMSRDEQVSVFQENVRLGSCGSGREQGLAAMRSALEQSRGGGCNSGFLRDGANLVVVVVSDEQDTDDTLVDQYVADLAQFKPYSKIRIAMVVGAVDGQASNCRIPNDAQCGSICQSRPADGSRAACTVTNMSMPCPGGEFCERVAQGNPIGQCQNEALRHWDPQNCLWCSFYNTPDCCSALNGSRYVDFARKVEARVVADVPRIPATSCTGRLNNEDVPIACLVDSICQQSFSGTLSRIARELVLSNTYTLDPAPVYPEGVVVKVKGGRFGEAGVALKYGEEFTIAGTELTITAGEKTPVEGENVEIFFVVDKVSDAPREGACGLDNP